jgi:hypothetical protein
VNGPIVLLLLFTAMTVVFVAIVWLDRWLDERETAQLIAQAKRREEAMRRLAHIHDTNPGHIRLGHRHGGTNDIR